MSWPTPNKSKLSYTIDRKTGLIRPILPATMCSPDELKALAVILAMKRPDSRLTGWYEGHWVMGHQIFLNTTSKYHTFWGYTVVRNNQWQAKLHKEPAEFAEARLLVLAAEPKMHSAQRKFLFSTEYEAISWLIDQIP